MTKKITIEVHENGGVVFEENENSDQNRNYVYRVEDLDWVLSRIKGLVEWKRLRPEDEKPL